MNFKFSTGYGSKLGNKNDKFWGICRSRFVVLSYENEDLSLGGDTKIEALHIVT